jgi:hypothetical protein
MGWMDRWNRWIDGKDAMDGRMGWIDGWTAEHSDYKR